MIQPILCVFLMIAVVLFLGTPLVVLLAGEVFPAPLHQPEENIAGIEILDTDDGMEEVLYTMEEAEFSDFMARLQQIKVGRIVNDPVLDYGIMAVQITYADGYVDTIGTSYCTYTAPDGREVGRGWYYMDKEPLLDLFAQYVKAA